MLVRLLLTVVWFTAACLAREFRGVWARYRAGTASLPLAIAFTLIVIQMVGFLGLPLVEKHLSAQVRAAAEHFLVVLFFASGALGALGLWLERRRNRSRDAPIGDPEAD